MANHARRPVFYPAGSCFGMVPEVGNNVRLVIGLERRLFPRFEPTFQDLRPGAEFDAMRAGFNAILTAASMRAGLSVWWETVYSDALPAWEQANPKTPPEDVHSSNDRYAGMGSRAPAGELHRFPHPPGGRDRIRCYGRASHSPAQVGAMHEIGGFTEDLDGATPAGCSSLPASHTLQSCSTRPALRCCTGARRRGLRCPARS